MAKSHKGQHFVPESYLKAWCDPACPPSYEPYVWLFNRDGSGPQRKAPSNIFKETDLYTIERADGVRDLRLEHGLSGLETKFSQIRRNKLKRLEPLSEEEHAYLTLFVAAAQFRTRSSRDHHANQWGNVLSLMDEMEQSMRTASKEKRQRMARISKITRGSRDKQISHEQVRALAAKPIQLMMPVVLRTITPILAKMNMMVLVTDDPIGFITSDTPVTWFDPEAYKFSPLFRSPVLTSKTIEITMPISPKQCVIFSWLCPSGYALAQQKVLDELNRRHRAHCDQKYVVRSNSRNEYWFWEPGLPEDAWDNRHTEKTD